MNRSNFINKKSKWKSLLFFFFLASLFWLLTKISKEFTAPVTATLEFINTPETISIKDVNSNEITFNLFANGYDFLGYKIKEPSLKIDISKFTIQDSSSIKITTGELLKEINAQFPSSRSATNINLDVLTLTVDPIVQKKVPVRVQKSITYKNGFRQIGEIRATPDSVLISGPNVIVAEIDDVITENIALEFVDSNVTTQASIKVPELSDLKVSNKIITVSWLVKEIAEKEFEIPITVINKPSSETIKIIPSKVKIKVDVTLDHFNDISIEDFKIICDYNTRDKNENFMVAYLKSKPEWAEHVALGTQKIDFLTFKE